MSSGLAASARIALVHSPHAGSAGLADPEALLRAAGLSVVDAFPVTELDTRGPDELVARWKALGVAAVVAAGGDGSVGAVATLADLAGLPLGVLPLGTANDTARALLIPSDPLAAARLIANSLARGEEWLVDAGELAPSTHSAGGLFLHALTMGLNVEFAHLATDVAQRRRWGTFTYAASALESLSHYIPLPVTVEVEGLEGAEDDTAWTFTSQITLMAAVNLPVFGGRLGLRLPSVRDDDHLLDFLFFEAESVSTLQALAVAIEGFVTALARGGRATNAMQPSGLRWFRARSVSLTTPEIAGITLDGEVRGTTPATVRVAPRPARILAVRPTR
ncbi:MAG TPA: diacylglycerol kinase family protein [Ktedonobacterales bacterium]